MSTTTHHETSASNPPSTPPPGLLKRAWRDIQSDPVQYAGSLASMVGAQMLALKWELAPFGWLAFFVGNLFFIGWGLKRKHYGIVLMQAYFFTTSVTGIYNHLLS